MPDEIVKMFYDGGLLGAFSLILLWVCYRLALKIDVLQEKRVADVERVVQHMTAMTTAMDRNTEAIERFTETTQR